MQELPLDDTPVSIAPGETHHRELELQAGDFVRALVDQQSVDVAVRLVGPGGEEAASVDSPNGKSGFEELMTSVEIPGRYRVEVVSISGEPGEYVLADLVHRPATAEDRETVAAERTFQAARKARGEEVVELYERALTTWKRLGHGRREIETLTEICRAYQAGYDYPLAVAFCEQALEVYRAEDDQRGMDSVLELAGWLHLRRGQVRRAVPYCEEAARRYAARGFDRGAAVALRNLGVARHQLGDTHGALAAFDEALVHSEAAGDLGTEAAVRVGFGNVLLDLRRLSKAARQYERILEIRRQQGKDPALARALEGVAFAAAELGDLERASAAIDEAFQRAGEDRLGVLDTTRGFVRYLQGDVDGARRDYEEALRRAHKSGNKEDERTALARLGQLFLETGQPGEALRYFDALLDLAADAPRWQARAHVHGGRALADLGRLEEAWQRIEPTLALVEGLRSAIDTRGTRTGYFASRQSYYEAAIDVLLRLHRRHPDGGYDVRAFAVNERRLVRELHESFAPPRPPSAVLARLRKEEKRLEGMLAEAALLPRDEPRREERLRKLFEQLEELTGKIRREALGETAPEAPAVDLDELRRELLDDDTLLLAYALGETRSFLWILSPWGDPAEATPSANGLIFRELAPRPQIEERAAAWATALGGGSSRDRMAAGRLSRELAELVLDGVPRTYRRIVLIVEGTLQAIPFGALPHPADGVPLISRHECVVVPSASALLRSRRARPAQTSSSIAVFADPVFDTDDPRLGGAGPPAEAQVDREVLRAAEYLGPDAWDRLAASGREAEAILELYGEDTFLARGFEASRKTLTSGRLQDRAVLHFATHAVLAGEMPELSGLVLSLVDEAGRQTNGFVRSFEIARLDLGAELVVLSACRTGVGRDVRGEGMQGLARAFLDAGAARVLYSLWEVPDRSTAELMGRFHAALVAHGEPAAALREAQLEMLSAGADPYRWAGFVLLGDWRKFDTKGAEDGEE